MQNNPRILQVHCQSRPERNTQYSRTPIQDIEVSKNCF